MHVPEDKTKRKMEFAGIPIDVQFDKGDRRHYPAANGFPEYNVTMSAIYGEVPRTKGTDGDPVDVYIGENATAPRVFIIRQMKFPKYESFDEEKCMLGFDTADEAKERYLKHHQNKKIFGGIKELSMPQFKERLQSRGREGKKLAELLFACAQRGMKISSEIYKHRAETGVLGVQPDTAEIPATTTPLNAALQDAAKVAALETPIRASCGDELAYKLEKAKQHIKKSSYAEKLQALERRRTGTETAEELAAHRESRNKHAKKEKRERDLPMGVAGAALGMLTGKHVAKGARGLVDKQIGKGVGKLLGAAAKHENASGTLKRVKALEHVREGLRGSNPQIAGAALGFAAGARKRDKTASTEGGRVGRIAERVDDVGIGMLAAPYAAKGISSALAHRGGRLGAVGQLAGRAANAMHHHENKLELGGLALVAPGVTNRIAKGIDRAVPGKAPVKTAALEEFARSINPEFEYLAEAEKLAYMGALRALGGAAKGLVQRGAQAVQGAAGRLATPGARTLTGTQAAAPARILTPGNVAKAGILAASAAGAVGAYKGTKAVGHFLGHAHENPIAGPQYEAPRVL